jgi:hypothetical protein
VTKTNRLSMAAICAATLIAAASASPSKADTPPTATTQPVALLSFSKSSIATVGKLFKSGDATNINVAVPIVRAWFEQYHVPAESWRDWFPVLVAQKRYADIADLCLRGLGGRPESRAYAYLLPARISALIALDQTADALQTAKSYYNVSDAHHMPNAMSYMILAFAKAHPDDPQIGAKFRAEQASATPPAEGSILHGITIDATPYETALAHWKAASDAGSVTDGLDYATLLLIVDRPAEAEPLFRKLLPLCTKKPDIAAAMDGIAASLRAQDQNPLRANKFLATTTAPAAEPTPPKGDKGDQLP